MVVKNWFVFVIGITYFVAAVLDIARGNNVLAAVWIGYGGSSIALSLL